MSLKDELFPRRVRKHFGLPLTGKTGVTRKERQRLFQEYGKFSAEKGKNAEDRFIKAWEVQQDLRSGYKGFISIRRATLEEDNNEKTDAFLEVEKLGVLRIQIKAYRTNGGHFFEFCKQNIVVISILPHDTPQIILDKTMALVTRFVFFRTHLFRTTPKP
jgi:hypothetical protein